MAQSPQAQQMVGSLLCGARAPSAGGGSGQQLDFGALMASMMPMMQQAEPLIMSAIFVAAQMLCFGG